MRDSTSKSGSFDDPTAAPDRIDWVEDELRWYFGGETPESPLGECLSPRQLEEFANGTAAPEARQWAMEHIVTCRSCADKLADLLRPKPVRVLSLEALLDKFALALDAITGGRANPAGATLGPPMPASNLRGTRSAQPESVALPLHQVDGGGDPTFEWKVLEDVNRNRRLEIVAQPPALEQDGLIVTFLADWAFKSAPALLCGFLALRPEGEGFAGRTFLPPDARLRRAQEDQVVFAIEAASIPASVARHLADARALNLRLDPAAADVWTKFIQDLLPETRKKMSEP